MDGLFSFAECPFKFRRIGDACVKDFLFEFFFLVAGLIRDPVRLAGVVAAALLLHFANRQRVCFSGFGTSKGSVA